MLTQNGYTLSVAIDIETVTSEAVSNIPTDRELLLFIAGELRDIRMLLDEFEPMFAKLRKRGKLPPPPERNVHGR